MLSHLILVVNIVLVVAVVHCLNPPNATGYSSLTDIGDAVHAGKQLASELQGYLKIEEGRLQRLRGAIGRLETVTKQFSAGVNDTTAAEVAENPIRAFLAIVQLASNWSVELPELFDLPVKERTSYASLKETEMRREVFLRARRYADMLPATEDVNDALEAILRFQETFKVPAKDVAQGRLLKGSVSPKLTEMQCMWLGLFSYNSGKFNEAAEWYSVVANRMDISPGEAPRSESVSRKVLYDHLAYALGRAGRYKEALEATKNLLSEGAINNLCITILTDPKNENGAINKMFYELELKRFNGNDPPPMNMGKTDAADENGYFEDLCRSADGETLADAKLTCFYTAPHPAFLLGPIKEEVVQLDPPIVLWHDFMCQSEVEEIIETARQRLQRATVRNPDSGKIEAAPYRDAKNIWLSDDTNELTKKINKRIEMFTGLSVESGEDLQVSHYGLGGYYAPHFDYARLAPVQAGGATAFTKTGTVLKPVGRSAVFWYNLLHSGDGDARSRHGACPVLAGRKWVMNKWLRAKGQEFKRKCLREREPFNEVDELDEPN